MGDKTNKSRVALLARRALLESHQVHGCFVLLPDAIASGRRILPNHHCIEDISVIHGNRLTINLDLKPQILHQVFEFSERPAFLSLIIAKSYNDTMGIL